MHATTVAIDLAKSVFQIAIVDDNWKVVAQERLTRGQFERWFQNRAVGLVVPQGARTGVEAMSRALAEPESKIPLLIRESMRLLIEEIGLLEQRISRLEKKLTRTAFAIAS